MRPRRAVKTTMPRPRRAKDTRPPDYFVKELIRMRDEQPSRFEKEVEGKPYLLNLIENYERVTKE